METMAKEPLNFKARTEIVDGKKILVIDPITETIDMGNGRTDVKVHLPSLDLINKCKAANNIE
jgi:hypothetical protein